MRTLVIAGEYPWPENSGSRMRLLTTLRGVRRCGPAELFSVISSGRADIDPPDEAIGLDAVGRVAYDDGPAHGLELLAALVRPDLPVGLSVRDRRRVRGSLSRFATGRYDLVWCHGVRPWVLTGAPTLAPAVVDFDDLEDRNNEARLRVAPPAAAGAVAQARHAGGRAYSQLEARRWASLHRRIGRRVATTVVCSRLDAERTRQAGIAAVEVVPNAYHSVDRPLGRLPVAAPPTVLFCGTLRYPPNADAARFLAREVGPALRRRAPDARIRLVGVHAPGLAQLHDPPRVTVTGRVPDIDTELAAADVVVAPVRYGSGTRVKILEAFAHRIPVAATTFAAEGLEAQDGVQLLLADGAEALAGACAQLLEDVDLRRRLTDAAHDLYLQRFRHDVVEAEIARIARGVTQR